MTIALISDIHGHAVALDAVLEAIALEGVDRIVWAGSHTHQAMVRRYQRSVLVNPGSAVR